MGETMVDADDSRPGWSRPGWSRPGWSRLGRRIVGPVAAGQRAHPAEHALVGPPYEPDRPVALDPICQPVPVRLRLLRRLHRQALDVGPPARAAVGDRKSTR